MPGPAPPDPHLHDGPVAVNLQHLAAPHLSIAEFQVHDLAVDGSLHTVDNHQGSSNGRNGLVLCEAETQAGSARISGPRVLGAAHQAAAPAGSPRAAHP